MTKQIIIIFNYNMQYHKDKYHSRLAQKLSDSIASSKHFDLF